LFYIKLNTPAFRSFSKDFIDNYLRYFATNIIFQFCGGECEPVCDRHRGGKPLVLIHSLPLNNAMYEYQYQYFVERGIRVIGITLRGFDRSDKPYGSYNYEVFAADIKAVLDELEIRGAVLAASLWAG
jgi:pimeloyl-ACP methyl ester carboxylesterase